VGRTQRALTSLVAAIPAMFLCYLLVMAFLNKADSLSTGMQIIVGATLAVAAFVALMPFGLFVLGGKKAAAAEAPAKRKGAADDEEIETLDEDAEVSDEVNAVSDELAETSDFNIGDSDASVIADSSAEIDTGPISSMDNIETVDFEDEDEEPKPKKKKR
jgi:hypothetical protein